MATVEQGKEHKSEACNMTAPQLEKKKPSRWNLFKKRWKKDRELLNEEQRGGNQQSSPNRSDATASSSDVNASFVKDIGAKKRAKKGIKIISKTKDKISSSLLEAKPQKHAPQFVPAAPDYVDLPKDTPTLKRAGNTSSYEFHGKKTPERKASAVKANEPTDKVEQKQALSLHDASASPKPYLNEFDPFGFVAERESSAQSKEEQWNSFVYPFPCDANAVKPNYSETYSLRSMEAHASKTVSASSVLKPAKKKCFTTGTEAVTKTAATKSDSPEEDPVMVMANDASSESFSKASSFCSLTWNGRDGAEASTLQEASEVIQGNAHVSSEIRGNSKATDGEASKARGVDSTKARLSPKSLKQMARARIAKEAEQAKELRMSVENNTPLAIAAEDSKDVESTMPGSPSESKQYASSSRESSADSPRNAYPEDPMMNPATGPRSDSAAKLKKRAVSAAVVHQIAAPCEDIPFDEKGDSLKRILGDRSLHVKQGSVRNAALQTPSEATWRTLGPIPELRQPEELVRKASSFELKRSNRLKEKRRSCSLEPPRKDTRDLSPLEVPDSKTVGTEQKQMASGETYPDVKRRKWHLVDKYTALEESAAEKELTSHYQSESLRTRWTGAKVAESELARPRWTTQNKPRVMKPSPPELTDFVTVEPSQEGEVEMTIPEEVKAEPIKFEPYYSDTSENGSTVPSCTDVTSDDGSFTDSNTLDRVDNDLTHMTDGSISSIANESRSRITITTDDSRSHVSDDSRSQASDDSKSYFTDDSGSYVTDESRSRYTGESRSYESRSSYITNDSRSYFSNDSRSYRTKGSRSTNVTDDFNLDDDGSSNDESNNEEEPQYLWEQIAETLILGKPWQV